jgi:hypothetical protein
MLTTLTPTHPFFDLPRERSRSYLTWARRLAQAEALLLLLGSCSLFDSGAGAHQINPFAIVAFAMAILWLTLGYFVGRGSARAAVILLGLSIARQVAVFMPGAPELANVVAPLILLDLFLFTQAARGAVALARSSTVNPLTERFAEHVAESVAEPVVAKPTRPVAVASGVGSPGFKWPVEWTESPADDSLRDTARKLWAARGKIWAPNFTLDFIVASFLVAVAMAWLALDAGRGGDNSGAAGLAGLFALALALWNLLAAIALFASAYGGAKGKSWAGGARAIGYGAVFLEGLTSFKLLWTLAQSS